MHSLLSPLPFVSFDHIVQDATAQSSTQNVPLDAPSFEIIPNLTVSPFGSMVNDTNGLDSINGSRKINTFEIDNSTHAGVHHDPIPLRPESIIIVNLTDPSSPSQASALKYDVTTTFLMNYTAYPVIDGSTYVISRSESYNHVLIINIGNISIPPLVPYVTDDVNHAKFDYSLLIPTVTIGTSIFTIVSTYGGHNVIIDITDPSNHIPVYSIAGFISLSSLPMYTMSVTTITIGSSTFALVSANNDGTRIIKLELEYISAYTSNQNPKYAKAGDTLGINFSASNTIASHTSQILGLDANATVNDAVYDATVTVPSTPRESYATFTIKVVNANGESITITENDISSKSNVFVDTISPSIELVGSADYAIPYGTLDPFIPNVTVSDGDPNYLGGFTLVKNATVDTTIIGSVYNYTYTANPDRSGNAGNSVTRTILVVDTLSCMDPESSYNIITGDNSSKILNGTAGNDLIYGTEGNDTINGLGGNDCIFGNGGNDVIDGGDGDDTIHGGFGHDIIKGGNDNDTLYGGNGKDTINGNAGNDVITGTYIFTALPNFTEIYCEPYSFQNKIEQSDFFEVNALTSAEIMPLVITLLSNEYQC